jgi:hypothetical protein
MKFHTSRCVICRKILHTVKRKIGNHGTKALHYLESEEGVLFNWTGKNTSGGHSSVWFCNEDWGKIVNMINGNPWRRKKR